MFKLIDNVVGEIVSCKRITSLMKEAFERIGEYANGVVIRKLDKNTYEINYK